MTDGSDSLAVSNVTWVSNPRRLGDKLPAWIAIGFLWFAAVAMVYVTVVMLLRSSYFYAAFSALLSVIAVSLVIAFTSPLTRGGRKRIEIDPVSKSVVFENVRFWKGLRVPIGAPRRVIPFDQVFYVESSPAMRGGPEQLIITTALGRAYLSTHAENLGELHRALGIIAVRPGPPITASVYFVQAVLIGLFIIGLIMAFVLGWLP